jgi:hypothetical protein
MMMETETLDLVALLREILDELRMIRVSMTLKLTEYEWDRLHSMKPIPPMPDDELRAIKINQLAATREELLRLARGA